MRTPSVQEFDMNDMGKLILIVVASDITRDALSKKRFYQNTLTSRVAHKR